MISWNEPLAFGVHRALKNGFEKVFNRVSEFLSLEPPHLHSYLEVNCF